MPHTQTEDCSADFEAFDSAARSGSTGVTKQGRRGRGRRGDWATVAKAVKEPAFAGPWVSSEEYLAGVVEGQLPLLVGSSMKRFD